MKTTDFSSPISSIRLAENLEKQFGSRVNLNKYNREQLEDMRNRLRTRVFQQEGSAKFNDLLQKESYQKDKAMLELLNTRIKEMLGENIKKLRDKMDELSEAKKGTRPPKTKITAKGGKGSGDDKTGDGKKDFDDIQVARMTAGGVPKKKAIAKATSDNFKEGIVDTVKNAVGLGKKPAPAKQLPPRMASSGNAKDDYDYFTGRDKTLGGEKTTKEGFPTVADARARAEKEKTTGKFNSKPNPQSGGTIYTKKHTKADAEPEKKVKEGMKHPKSCDCKECMSTFEGKDQGKPGKNFAKIAKKAGGGEKGNKIAGAVKAKLAKQGKLEESLYKHNVRFVNESLAFLLREDEEGKAKTITAAGDMVNDFTSWMQRVGQYQTKAIIELSDQIRAEFGQAEAEQFKQTVGPALSATLETLTTNREAISSAVATLAGEAAPEDTMGMDPMAGGEPPMEPGMDASMPDEMNPELPGGDEFGASDAAAGGAETAGRAMREGKEVRRARKLAEAHSIMAKLAK